MTMLMLLCCNISAQTHLTFMGIPITGTRQAMVTKLKAKGFSEKTQENEVGVELKGNILARMYGCVYIIAIYLRPYILLIYFSKKVILWTCTSNISVCEKSSMAYMVPHRNS